VTDERTLAYLQELAEADEAAAAELAELDQEAAEAERIGAEANALRERLARLPAEREKGRAAREEAEREAEERRQEHEAAVKALAEVEGDKHAERVAAARRDELRTRDLAHAAERRLEAARAEVERLDREEAEDRERSSPLAEEARALGEATGHPLQSEDLYGIADWATETRAALAVARAGLRSQREALIRQASELGSVLLGEPVLAETPAEVARRLNG
jgi:hypothetical protein